MGKSTLHSLSAAALLACTAVPAIADTFGGADLDLSVDGRYVLVSSIGNAFTFAALEPYAPDGNTIPYIYNDLFTATAHAGKALTGSLGVSFQATYQSAPPPWPYQGDYSASFVSSVSVLAPVCDMCGPLNAVKLGHAYVDGWALTATPAAGTLSGSSTFSAAAGSYDMLYAYASSLYSLSTNYGSINLTSFTLSFETGPLTSPVPELPPVALIGIGLAAIATRARLIKARDTGGAPATTA